MVICEIKEEKRGDVWREEKGEESQKEKEENSPRKWEDLYLEGRRNFWFAIPRKIVCINQRSIQASDNISSFKEMELLCSKSTPSLFKINQHCGKYFCTLLVSPK